MPKLANQVKDIAHALELQRMPIGARFSESPDRNGVTRKQRICEALNVIRQENVVVNLSKENCTCKGGCHIAGWQTLSHDELAAIYLGAKAYESKEAAEASVSKQPQPTYRGRFLILGPLDKFEADPDAVLFFVNPAQADRILGLASYKESEPFMAYPVTSMCSTITYALAKGKPDVNFISVFERRRGTWSPNELIVTLPFKDFQIAVESIPHSGYGSPPAST
jgi:uncharacterized protein (DUF169 family)